VNTTYYSSGSTSTGPVTEDTTFTATCVGTGAGSLATSSVTVYIKPGVRLTASSTDVAAGEPIYLNWTSEGVNNCVASGDWSGDRETGGVNYKIDTDDNIFIVHKYYITCFTPTGSMASSSVVVNVGCSSKDLKPVKVATSTASDCSNTDITLSWNPTDYDPSSGVYFNIYRGGAGGDFIASTTDTSFTDQNIVLTDSARTLVYALETVYGDEEESDIALVSVEIPSKASCSEEPTLEETDVECKAYQDGETATTTVILNKKMTWKVNIGNSKVKVNSVRWTDENDLLIGSGNPLQKIYTTIGKKTAKATVSYGEGKSVTCTPVTVRVISRGGGGGEI
jgi:hypothetical protein